MVILRCCFVIGWKPFLLLSCDYQSMDFALHSTMNSITTTVLLLDCSFRYDITKLRELRNMRNGCLLFTMRDWLATCESNFPIELQSLVKSDLKSFEETHEEYKLRRQPEMMKLLLEPVNSHGNLRLRLGFRLYPTLNVYMIAIMISTARQLSLHPFDIYHIGFTSRVNFPFILSIFIILGSHRSRTSTSNQRYC